MKRPVTGRILLAWLRSCSEKDLDAPLMLALREHGKAAFVDDVFTCEFDTPGIAARRVIMIDGMADEESKREIMKGTKL